MTYSTSDGTWVSEGAMAWLSQLLILNSRLFLLVAVCLLLVRLLRGSAARRHLLIASAFIAALFLPLLTQWIPAFEIVIEVKRSISAIDTQTIAGAQTIDAVSSGFDKLPLILLLIYSGVTALLLIRVVLSNIKIARIAQEARSDSLQRWHQTLSECVSTIGLKHNIAIRHSPSIHSPMTWGFKRPSVFIPTQALNWPESLRRSTLLHELAHIKRRDCLSKQIARIVCACYWINPLCWVALRRLNHYAESASDDMALNSGIKYSLYAQNLLSVAMQSNHECWGSSAALAMAEPSRKCSHLSQRVTAVLNPEGCRKPINWFYLCLSFGFVFGFLLPLSSLRANVVQEIRYVVTDPRHVVPLRPAKKEEKADDLAQNKVSPLNAEDPAWNTLTYPQSLKDQIRPKPVPEQPAPVDYIELSSKDVLEHAKNKVKQTLASIRKDAVIEHANQTAATEAVDAIPKTFVEEEEVIHLNLASLASPHQAADYLFKQPSDESNTSLHIEPYSAERLVTPSYPRRAQYRGIEGELLVEFSINDRGRVVNAKVISAKPNGIFERAVLRAVQQNRYRPQKIDGKAVAVSGVQEKYVFVLES